MRDDRGMRTTLDIDDDLLQAAKEIAGMREDAGQVVSELLRTALQGRAPRTDCATASRSSVGVPTRR
jgi:Arc/MetJ family transcription regulator